jgi:uncharacterized protein (DUF983 family)
MVATSTTNLSAFTVFWRGFRRLCPRCGQGRMFSGYLSVREACESCQLAFEPLRSDDAPPYFTLLIVGHLVVSLYLLLWPYMPFPDWVHALIWCSLTLVLSLVMLPFVKGGVMAIIFRTKATQ